jgi:hypothetical protein
MGIESVMETVIGLALFASAFGLLGFFIGEMHGRPKLRRDKRTGRFVRKGEFYLKRSELQKSVDDCRKSYDPLFMEIDNE